MGGRRWLGGRLGGGATRTAGAVDRAHEGLVSGWLHCPACTGDPAVRVWIDDVEVSGRVDMAPRSDVPGGTGFVLRWEPSRQAPVQGSTVRVACPRHHHVAIERAVPAAEWAIRALGRIENLSWPHVSGWVARFGGVPSDEPFVIDVGARARMALQPSVSRPDVQVFLGRPGVVGFQVDFGDVWGYAAPDGAPVRLMRGDVTLDEVVVTGSPLASDTEGCLPDAAGVGADGVHLQRLTHRFRRTVVEPGSGSDWRRRLESLGVQDHSPSTRQWADYLRAAGLDEQQTADLLALRSVGGLRVPALNPIPSTSVDAGTMAALPDRVREWSADLLSHPGEGGDAPAPATDDARDRVCVAGLVHHRSGLGQNAVHSLTALRSAGIHACPAPFFPAPGGWNPRLAPSGPAIDVLSDHAVLLHLPIDGVVPSLSAQGALLASPRLIGYFMWETAVVPQQLRRSLDLVDEIWTATEFVADAFRQVTGTPVHVTGHAVDVSDVEVVERAELGIADDAFVVHFSFDANSTVARKNPNAAIDAFYRAFGGDPSAVFLLKVRNMQQAEHLARAGDPYARGLLTRLRDHPDIRLVTGEHSHGRSLGLASMADCVISLHRAEGYGYTIAEAMALGTPIVATDYSGSTDLLSAREGWPVPFDLVEVLPEDYFYWQPGMQWAEADPELAAEALRDVRFGKGTAERVRLAQERIRSVGSMEALSAAYLAALNGG